MKKVLILIFLTVFCHVLFAANADWRLHPIFDEEVSHVVDTPDYVYFTSRNMAENQWNEAFFSLFRYDKKGEEMMALSKSNLLNGNGIRDVVYNPEKGYLMVLYKDYNIDLLHNNGRVTNIPYYARSNTDNDKKVNSISIDPDHDRIYLATDFGYVAINDKKNEIAESRLYGQPLKSFVRVGDTYFVLKDNEVLRAGVDRPRLSLADYESVAVLDRPSVLYPVNDKYVLVVTGVPGKKTVKRIGINTNSLDIENLFDGDFINIENTKAGITFATGEKIYCVLKDGAVSVTDLPTDFQKASAGTSNLNEIWLGEKRKGLAAIKKTGDRWSVTRDFMRPNAPSPYASTSFLNHPELGLLVLNYGYTPATVGLNEAIPFELSSYKQSRWSNLAPSYTNPDRMEIMLMTNGMAIDPENPDYLYITSAHNGIVRLNLKNPQDILHLSRDNDPDTGNAGFVTLVNHSDYLPMFANFSAPCFDKQGNLWMNYVDWDDRDRPNPHLYVWSPEDRRASMSSSDIRLPKLVEADVEVPVSNTAFVLPLLKTGNGVLVHARAQYDESLVLIDTNGTPEDSTDDKVYKFPYFIDQDGNNVDLSNIRSLYEDSATGYVWVTHRNGVCYFVPSNVLSGNFELNRVKVARNDGTNLADYLLDGVDVNQITVDSEGRKWFATAGAGLICTTSDGREIIAEFNSSNSLMPDDLVYGCGYNREANSLMISTAQGFVEYFLPAQSSGNSKKDVRAYPNPVRPEYSGYVTITDIPEGSLVKIVDVAGNLVKELGTMNGFEILWDLSDTRFNRVRSGVYHIVVSPSDNYSSSYSTVGKILVIS